MTDLAKLSFPLDSHTVLLLLLATSTPDSLCQEISGNEEKVDSIFTEQNRESGLPAVMVSF